MNRTLVWMIIGVIISLSMIVLYMIFSAPTPKKQLNTKHEERENLPNSEADDDDNRVVVIKMNEYVYFPSELTINANEDVTLKVENAGFVAHNIVFDELPINVPTLASGDNAEIVINVEETGDYIFYSSISNHRKLGMEGVLHVR